MNAPQLEGVTIWRTRPGLGGEHEGDVVELYLGEQVYFALRLDTLWLMPGHTLTVPKAAIDELKARPSGWDRPDWYRRDAPPRRMSREHGAVLKKYEGWYESGFADALAYYEANHA